MENKNKEIKSMDLVKLFRDLQDFREYKNTIRFGHYGKEELNKALDLLIKELDYLTVFKR